MTFSRRAFLRTTAVLAGTPLLTDSLAAIEPINRSGKPLLKLSLAAYSFRQKLDLKKQPKPEMTLFDFINFAAKQPLEAVELTAYYFPETSPQYLGSLKRHCTRLGLDISGTAVGNNFCVTDPARQQTELQNVKQWIEHTSRLGGKTIRIFAGSVAKGDTEEKALARCIPAIQEACDYAQKFGIYLALENHGGITSTPEQLLGIVKAVKHDCFGVNLDTGNFHGEDPYTDLEKLAPYAVNVQVKTEIQRAKKMKEDADLKRLIDMLRKVNYRGYVVLEYEASEPADAAVPKHLDTLRKLIG